MAASVIDETWASLQKQLDLVSRLLMGDLFLAYRPRLILQEAETASTDGQRVVMMPRRFLDVSLEDGRPEIFLGLLAHEVGHWLQPIKEIRAAEKETGLAHGFVNIILDVHCEHNAGQIFPLFKGPLQALRNLVGKRMVQEYRQGFRKANDFVSAASAALLFSRYCLETKASYCAALIGSGQLLPNPKAAYDADRLQRLLWAVSGFVGTFSGELPDRLRLLAAEYPELCCQASDLRFTDPLGWGGDDDVIPGAVQLNVPDRDKVEPCGIRQVSSYGSQPPTPEVLALSRRLKSRWMAPSGVHSFMAPGRLDRMAALRNQPVPYSMKAYRPARLKEDGLRRILLAVDWSGSMSAEDGRPWEAALTAARAITLAIQADGGDVRSLLFAGEAWHTAGYDAQSLLFARSFGGHLTLEKAQGSETRFGWLPEVWQRFPEHQVLVLTDGAGCLPACIPVTCRTRTSVLLIGLEQYKSDGQKQILEIADAIAGKVVEVQSLDDLAGVWATLIPRRQVA